MAQWVTNGCIVMRVQMWVITRCTSVTDEWTVAARLVTSPTLEQNDIMLNKEALSVKR